MSNKITLATIQFRADAKGANAALESLRQSSKDAHDEANRMREALDKGIKTMKDANGIDFDVAKKFSEMTKQAKNFDQAIRELVKGATALETVVKNIRIGQIEASSRAELKGAINAAEARKRSVRETDPEDLQQQRELNIVIEESRKQLNNLDRDTQKVIETLDKGGTIAQSTLEKEMKGLREILTMIPKGTEEWNKYNQQLQQMETHVTNIRRQEREQASALLGSKDLGKYSEEDIRAAITNAKELLATYKTASPEAKQLADNIVRAEQFLKGYGVEAARQAAREAEQLRLEKELAATMNRRLRDLMNLSADALEETRRYWEAQRNGAAEGTTEFIKAEVALKKIDEYTRSSRRAELTSILGDPSKFGVSEVKAAVQEAEKLRDSVQKGIPVWFQYNKMVEQGRAYLDQMAKSEAAERINQQMKNLNTTLSDAGLQEVKRYWETMVAGAEKGSRELTDYEAKLKEVIAEEQSRKTAAQQRSIDLFASRDLGGYSEKEIREAIEAAKQLIQTYDTADPAAKRLAEDIVRAEEHLKQYGVEAERTAAREREMLRKAAEQRNEMNHMMIQQLADTGNLSPSILKAQEQYWQRLIDDPKTASESLAAYKNMLDQVHRLQEAMVQGKGRAALDFFRGGTGNASASEIRQKAEALKKYRDSLPQQTNAALIQEIDRYLEKVGKTAEKASEETMRMAEAMTLSANAGKTAFGIDEHEDTAERLKDERKEWEGLLELVREGGDAYKDIKDEINLLNDAIRRLPFSGTTEDLKKAQRALEEALATTDKGTPKYERLRMALSRIKAEMAGAGISAKKTQEVLANPKAEKNVETLKNAVARARAELGVMGQRLERMRSLLAQAEKNGNTRWADRLRKSIAETSKQYDELARSTKMADQAQKELSNTAKGTASAFEKAWSRLKTYVGLYVGASVAMNKLVGTMGDLMDLSDKMGEVRKTTGFTADEVGHLTGELKKMDTRTTINGLLDLSVAAGQLGLKTEEDVLGFTEAANKLMVALPEMGKEGATEMLKVALATGEISKIEKEMQSGLIEGSSATAVAMEKIGSTIDRLRATSAATAPAITDFVKRVGAVGAQSGITIDQVAALGSTVDALGMRVEMSATALSRMIPAIKNNAFALAQAIGITPETIRNLFDTGRGMEVILMVLQRIKDSGMDADSIEQMLGMAGMKDIMKDLNQQGARAGIVFAGLSQNVDTLRKHLVTASEAYEENVAIQQEYDKMNETTAAKWERLKNQLEETFIGDGAQRFLGGMIEGLRKIVDLLTGSSGISVALRSILLYVGLVRLQLVSMASGALKGIGTGLRNIGIMLGFIKGEMTKLQWGNIFTAAAGAVLYLVMALKDAAAAVSSVAKAIAQLEEDLRKEIRTLSEMFHAVSKTNVELGKARSRLEEVKKAGNDAADAENRLKKASADHAAAIRDINSKYGSYLGYMLSETSSAEQLARARELINSKLRETITLKQREAALGGIEQEFGGRVNKKAADVEQLIENYFGDNYDAASRVSVAISEAAQKYAKDQKAFNGEVRKIVNANRNYISQGAKKGFRNAYAQAGRGVTDSEIVNSIVNSIGVRAEDYRKSVEEYRKQEDVINRRFEAQVNVARKDSREAVRKDLNQIIGDWNGLLKQYSKAEGEQKQKLAVEVYKQQRAYANAVANNAEYFEGDEKRMDIYKKNIATMQKYEKELRSVAGEAIRTVDAMERAETKVTGSDFTSGGESAKNPWGRALGAESTDWKNMTAEQLVNRRKQMNDFVNAIQTDTDVQSVLKEDAALKAAIEKGMSSDMRTVIEWYNTERLKIQDELHARHLTNTGDWLDPKKERGRKKRLQEEWNMYLKEIDAYYTERRTRIEEAGTEDGITEAEVRNRTLANEMEWHQRRAELQKLYADRSKEVAEDEQKAIFDIISERTGEDASLVEKTIGQTVDFMKRIGEKSPKELEKALATLGLGWERDFLKQQKAVTQQMKAIEDIIDKERPFNGITKNLRENLVTMGILTADMAEERDRLMREGTDMSDFNARQAAEEVRRTAFVLGEAENAYSTTVEDMMRRMADAGMEAWADELRRNPKMREGLMAELQATYDKIQDAIKKEASLIKKQTDIWWADIMPGGDQSRKGGFERMLSSLGLSEDQVKRANQLIGAGYASERVADKLAIRQMKVRLAMQETYFNRMRQIGEERIAQLKAAGKLEDAEHLRKSLNLSLSEEQKKLDEQRVAIANQLEESQNRLYQELKAWAELLSSSVRQVLEASHAGDAEYYNERAKMDLTGKGGPGAGTYVVIDNEGTSGARAHYEHLDQRQALERQREIERQNAMAEAWRKVMDDISQKMNEAITDQINAMLQNQSIDANTQAEVANTEAIQGLTAAIAGAGADGGQGGSAAAGRPMTPQEAQDFAGMLNGTNPFEYWTEASAEAAESILQDQKKIQAGQDEANRRMQQGAQSTFAKMAQAANLYGAAYQAMSNDNLSTAQKFEMFALQSAGQAAISMLTTNLLKEEGDNAVRMPGILGKLLGEMPYPAAMATYAAVTALLGGLMGLAVSKITKSKSQIAQITGAGANAGRLTTGMLAYAEGNVNEFTDPDTLTPGRQYNVDAADGRTYRARYTGRGVRTHITSGPEFHLVGEAGREAIIDARTTRHITMNEPEIWRTIQTLSGGGRILASRRRGRGVRAFAGGNVDDFAEAGGGDFLTDFDPVAMQASLDRNSAVQEALLERLSQPIYARNILYGPEGLPNIIAKLQEEARKHGEKYL
ncbi:MAG: phage tail tape measure protein [Prevotella sp.]|nr:phage tail tape measure protein [Prevotella sp.]